MLLPPFSSHDRQARPNHLPLFFTRGTGERKSARSGKLLYQFEYRVEYPGLAGKEPTYTVCVVGAAANTLFTFASRVPEAVWKERQDVYREAASSFVLL